MSDSMQPHRRQPIRLPCPWDSPGKNTGVGCHFLLQCMKVKSESEVTQLCPYSLRPHGLQPTRRLCPWDFPGKNTGVGCHCLLWKPYYENTIIPNSPVRKQRLRGFRQFAQTYTLINQYCRISVTSIPND